MAKRPEDMREPDVTVSDLEESVGQLLEDAGLPEQAIDEIMALVRAAEIAKAKAENDLP